MSGLVAFAAAEACHWLTQKALPLWGTVGIENDGLFQERLDFEGRPDRGCPRRMRVQARQLYVFSEAALRGWWPGARAVADAGFEALLRDCWARDDKPGFLHTLTPDRAPLDIKRDTYDHAFGLFALAWYYKLTAAPRALALAHEVLDLLERDLADPVNGGFVESIPHALPRRSDPHMHLLEATLEWFEASGEARFRDFAGRMVTLFKTRFFERDTGTLREFFGADLGPDEGPLGQTVAPGHHFEWSWLLAWAARLGAGQAKVEAHALYVYGLRFGLDPHGFAIDECDRHGRQVRCSRRAWPQTELIKAYVNAGAADEAARLTQGFLNSYLATDVPGLWMDQFDPQGAGMTEWVPASTLYHVTIAFRELMLFTGASALPQSACQEPGGF